MDKLKPCKRCHGKNFTMTYGTNDTDGILHWQWFVRCEDCGFHTDGDETKEEAVEAWNRMADDGHKNED